ncbi:hypothetical protein CHL76_02110 [Marinococcus halophilus]|uniref:Lipoprotein n=1 Tax=Marinococcus halophilus TaxID=1371 RepID=A0A510Y2M8_MARHA|nr:hypothetical protein [Marinococcus halophilus]OZT81171.1 hypothetical protein CHL76_02110 [Marinococcus halophilus]GEK57101.1 hypothetical protein MHA01_00060 [Marinococcus halophilus]
MKKQLVMISLSSLLALSACVTSEESGSDSSENKENKDEASANDSSSEEDTKTETAEMAAEETSERFEKLHKTMATFSLPEKGRLSSKEAKLRFGEILRPEDEYKDVIVYDNSMIFYKNTKETYTYSWINYDTLSQEDKPEPYGTQALGALKYRVNHDMVFYPSIFEENAGTPLKNLDEYKGDKKTLIASGELVEKEGKNPTGYEAIEAGSQRMLSQLHQLEPYVEQFDAVHDWTTETIYYFEEAESYDEEEWKEAYKYYKKGVDNIDEMEKAING